MVLDTANPAREEARALLCGIPCMRIAGNTNTTKLSPTYHLKLYYRYCGCSCMARSATPGVILGKNWGAGGAVFSVLRI